MGLFGQRKYFSFKMGKTHRMSVLMEMVQWGEHRGDTGEEALLGNGLGEESGCRAHGQAWPSLEGTGSLPSSAALGGGLGELGVAGTWGIVQGTRSCSFIFSVAWIRSCGRGGERPWPEVYGERHPARPEGAGR